MEIIYSPESVDDLIKIYTYIASVIQAPDNAKELVNRLRRNIRKLDYMPFRHRLVEWEPWNSMGMRVFPVDNFDIYYLVDTEKSVVQIVRIFYSGRDIENLIKTQNERDL